MFGEAKCFACHRFASEGGAFGPDLTALAGRFNAKDLIESIVEPSKVISDQYAAVNIVTTDGKVVSGRIINLFGDKMSVNTDMLDPNKLRITGHHVLYWLKRERNTIPSSRGAIAPVQMKLKRDKTCLLRG